MPEGLDIERGKPLKGTMPPYAMHVVVRTGREDWGRRIEDGEGEGEGEETGVNFARSLKGLVGPGGKFFDVCVYGYILSRLLSGVSLMLHTYF